MTNGQTAPTVQGENVTFDLSAGAKVNDANITTTNIEVANGIIHLIDKVILPPSVLEGMNKKNIVELAVGTPALSTLVAAVQAAGLVETLSSEGPFTVFAPTNDAFAALPAGTLDNLLKPENKDQLISILTYHVVAGKIMAADLQNGQKAATVQGSEITVDLSAGAKINDATVIMADVDASNG
ncbi:MAG: fasciclin domain-containing protein, partial [Saprospiraceae bacterium]|nr:fasciclin domain-containing protein [Saprospiraceae bacterium]